MEMAIAKEAKNVDMGKGRSLSTVSMVVRTAE
jgi:hypothetical protein